MNTITTSAAALSWKGAYRHSVRIAGPVGSYRTICGIPLTDRISTIDHGRVEIDCPSCIEGSQR